MTSNTPGDTPRLTSDVIAQVLRQMDAFRALDPRAVTALATAMEPVDAAAQTVLLREGAASNMALLVARGQVGLYKTLARASRVRFTVAGPGALVGHEGLLDGGPVPYSALSLQRSLLLRVDRPTFLSLTRGAPGLGSCLIEPAASSAAGHVTALRQALVEILRAPERHVALVRAGSEPGRGPRGGLHPDAPGGGRGVSR